MLTFTLAGAIALLPLPYAAGLLIGLGCGVLALIDPIWALYAAVLSVPFQEVVQLPGGLSVTQASLLLAVGALGLHTLAHPERRLPLGRLFWPLAIFVWALGLSTAFTPYSQSEALRETLRWSTVLLIYVLALSALRATGGAYAIRPYKVEALSALRAAGGVYAIRPYKVEALHGLPPQPLSPSPSHPVADWRLLGLLACLLAAPAAEALLGVVQHFTGDGPPSFEVAPGRVRAYGTIGQPNSFAGYMNQAWPLAAGLALFAAAELGRLAIDRQRRSGQATYLPMSPGLETGRSLEEGGVLPHHIVAAPPRARERGTGGEGHMGAPQPREAPRRSEGQLPLLTLLVAGGAGALIGSALLLSFSRGGWVGALGGGAAMTLAAITKLGPRLRRLAWGWVLAGALGLGLLLGLGGAGLLPGTVAQRLSSITANLRLFDVRSVEVNPANFAVVERMAHLQAGWGMLQARPLLGVGPGNYSVAYNNDPALGQPAFAVRPWYDSRGHAHNYYLHIAAEAGLLGAGAYLLLLGASAYQARRALIAARGWLWNGVVVGCIGVAAAVATHNIFENLHVLNMGLQLGTIWALLVAAERES